MEKKNFTIKDLKTGHIIEMRDGDIYVFFKGKSVCSLTSDALFPLGSTDTWSSIEEGRNSFKCDITSTMDIIKVYEVKYDGSIVGAYRDLVNILSCDNWQELKHKLQHKTKIVWEEGVKKLTVAEVSKLLGYKVEIVEET